MSETVIIGILIALFSGLGVVCVRTPSTFEKMWKPLLIAAAFIMNGMGAFVSGFDHAYEFFSSHVDSVNEIDAVKERLGTAYDYALFVFFGFIIFLAFLSWYAEELHSEDKPKE